MPSSTNPDQPSPFADHFSAGAARYAAARPRYPEALFAYLAGIAGRHEIAWDCAAGTGQASIGLAGHFVRVVATDASAAQIAAAAPDPRIEYRVAPADSSGLAAGSIDLVTVAQALHWLDVPAFYREARRVLRPGGVLAVWTYGLQRLGDAALDALLLEFYRDTVGPFWPAGRGLVDTGYRTLPFPFPELDPPHFEMTVCWTLPQFLMYVRTWSAVARFQAARDLDPVAALEPALSACWGAKARAVSWPLTLRLGRSGDASR